MDFVPGWARIADFASAALLLVAATIAISGGFRTHVGDWHFGVTSPLRVLGWAVAIAAARHALARRRSIVSHLAARVSAWARSAAVITAAQATVATRPAMIFVGYLAVLMIGYAPGAQPFHEFSNELFNLPLRWDSAWYLHLASAGYEYIRDAGPDLQQNIVFFPAYPMLVRAIALLAGNSMGAYVIGGTVASLALFTIALAYLYRIARGYLTDEQSTLAVWLLAAYPFAIFFGAVYTESLYLAGVTGAFHHLQRREWARSAAWALVVGLTRPNGFLLCVPLVIAAVEQSSRSREPLSRAAVGVSAMPLVGVCAYSLFVWRVTGDPLAWASGHAAWGRHYTGLAAVVTNRYHFIATAGLGSYVSREPYDFVNALGLLFVLASVWPLARRFSIALAVFVVVNVVPPLTTGGLMSVGRLSSVMFPAFIWLAAAVPARHRLGWLTAFASMQALSATLFYTWRPLF
jgi:hypothetical protein